MKKYNTKQRKLIYEFFLNNQERYFTVEEIKRNISSVGTATLYRYLNILIEEGEIVKFINDDNASIYKFSKETSEGLGHFKCKGCSKIYDFNCDIINGLKNNIKSLYRFDINFNETLFNGLCKECGDTSD